MLENLLLLEFVDAIDLAILVIGLFEITNQNEILSEVGGDALRLQESSHWRILNESVQVLLILTHDFLSTRLESEEGVGRRFLIRVIIDAQVKSRQSRFLVLDDGRIVSLLRTELKILTLELVQSN